MIYIGLPLGVLLELTMRYTCIITRGSRLGSRLRDRSPKEASINIPYINTERSAHTAKPEGVCLSSKDLLSIIPLGSLSTTVQGSSRFPLQPGLYACACFTLVAELCVVVSFGKISRSISYAFASVSAGFPLTHSFLFFPLQLPIDRITITLISIRNDGF